ncbi:hypothetical protein G6F56_006172 [Rhizopus delemar]|uniref:Yeast cell wall synthesis Kre9/Knh1-like N-terminal domain-containing protein n=1 Tax=Rhizopus stolonifer TaxID=4846 RepID=A0A367J8V1_RHIST|nr:hypothetical protein G6F56_006172 [Rhizopus delemar]RCH86171.1 hypothetical protein CU098_006082 [Rhizopus stolonifer]
MKFIVAAIAAFAVSMVSAQSAVATPHSPTLNQVLTAGQTTTIAWTPVTGVDTISSIDLLSGSATALQPVAGGHVASNVQASLGTYSWTVPADLPTGTDYALSFGTSPNVSYTPYFTIQAASSSSGSAAVSSTSAAASSTAASSTAASSTAASSSAVSSVVSSVTVSSAVSSVASSPVSSAAASSTAASSVQVSSPVSIKASSSVAVSTKSSGSSSAAAAIHTSSATKNTVGLLVAAGAVVAILI